MKTSILISSFAALCLLVTFAEAPRRHGGDKMNSASADNTSIATVMRATMLSGVTVTADRKNQSINTLPAIPVEDFDYLVFNAAEYMETDAVNPEEVELLPEAIETDYSYLKFDVNNYSTDSEIPVDAFPEMPVNENPNVSVLYEPEPVLNEFEYLRFNVNGYMNNKGIQDDLLGELPLAETNIVEQGKLSSPLELTSVFGYLKFDVTKFYSADSLNYNNHFELPEE